jgi:hypothetical protein
MIDLTPNRKGYINLLARVARDGKSDDKEWAIEELVLLANGATYMGEKA